MTDFSVYTRRHKVRTPGKLSFATVVATPTQADRIAALETQIQALVRENKQLKERLEKVERTQAAEDETIRTGVKEVTSIKAMLDTHTQAQNTAEKNIDIKIQAALREKNLQQKNALKVRIGGLPKEIDTGSSLQAVIDIIQTSAPQINFDPSAVETVCNQTNHLDGERIPSGHALLTFKQPTDRIRLLQQSRLLKDTSIWMTEELTLMQLKNKGTELKKVAEARAKGKWAVYRGGRAIIQEFRSPKPTHTVSATLVGHPSTPSPSPSPPPSPPPLVKE